MRRTARLLTVAATPVLLAGITVSPASAGTGLPDPLAIPKATLTVQSTASFGGDSITFTVNGSFTGGLVANSVVAIQGEGVEIYTTSSGVVLTAPIACHGESVHFDSSNSASCTAQLHSADSIVQATWTAEGAGAAPTPFLGTCAGSATRTGGTELILPTC